MNDCVATRERFSEYLDCRVNGRDMRKIEAHLDRCPNCAREWEMLRRTQASLAALGPVSGPADLPLRIRVAVSQERAQSRRGLFHGWQLAWKNTLGPFLLQASAGLLSAVLLLGTVIVMVGMLAQPEAAQANTDEPLGNPTAPRLVRLSTAVGNNDIGALAGPVVVEAYINDAGQVYDYRIVSGPNDPATRSQVENLLLYSVFEPARFFGQPVRGLAVLSFAGVSVRG